jgi:hypothetical protein
MLTSYFLFFDYLPFEGDINASSVLDAEDAPRCCGTIAKRPCHRPHLREVE